MNSLLSKNVIKKKVLAKVNDKINDLQQIYDGKCAEIDSEYREKRLALLEELASMNEVIRAEKEGFADGLVDSILP
jgi:hypothetical protein